MFLCVKCHPKDCPRAFIEELPFGRSWGPCENCHAEAECVDCQGYKVKQRGKVR